MTAALLAKSNGTQAAIQVNGTDALVLDASGIASGIKPASITPAMLASFATLGNYANDAAAAAGGVAVGGVYRNGSALQVRVT